MIIFLFKEVMMKKKRKEKYEKKVMKNNFNDYIDASHNKIENYYEVDILN